MGPGHLRAVAEARAQPGGKSSPARATYALNISLRVTAQALGGVREGQK